MSWKSLSRIPDEADTLREASTEPAVPEDRVRIGRILKPHGIRGAFFIHLEEPDRLKHPFSSVYVRHPRGRWSVWQVEQLRAHRHGALLAVREITTRDEAEAWRGAVLYLPATQQVPLEEEEYYVWELRACRVIDEHLGVIGEIEDIWPLPHHDILMVRGTTRRHILIPFVRDLVTAVEIRERRIRVRLPRGYLDLYR